MAKWSFSALISLVLCCHANEERRPTVVLDSGVYVGTTTQLATATPIVNTFLGIPFATPAQRFEKTQPVHRSRKVQNATELPPVRYQQYNDPESSHSLEE